MSIIANLTSLLFAMADTTAEAAEGAATAVPQPTDTEPATFWMPQAASTVADRVDWLFYGILGLSVVCFVGITVAVIMFVAKYRHRPGHASSPSASHNDSLEITWTIIPTIVVAIIFVLGWRGYTDLITTPKHAIEVLVTGQKWNWQYTYPNGWIDSTLHVPVDEPVRLVMKSEDVLHSYYIPAFRIKQDVMPQRYTQLWFEANEVGNYRVYCTEYCGQAHSSMSSVVVVHPPGGFEKYLEKAEEALLKLPPAELGEYLYNQRGCKQCHSVDGAKGTGPSFKGIWGKPAPLADGTEVMVDENYIRQSILEPQSQVHAGYNPVMPTYKGKLKDKHITGLVEYIKSLGEGN